MNQVILRAATLAFALGLAGTAQAYTERMPVEESQAIKRSMLPPGGRLQDYELDHCVPLCLDGSTDRSNLQLQPWPLATQKDEDERRLCRANRRAGAR